MEGMVDDHKKFVKEAGGDLKRAKEYNNCISLPFFQHSLIPSTALALLEQHKTLCTYYLHQVCLPGLHMT